jgi:hypothetical protein
VLELLAKVYDCWYAVVCCMCHKTLELKATEEEHMKMSTSHTYCEGCQAKVMEEINVAYLLGGEQC